MNVAMMSFFMDELSDLEDKAAHLLSKGSRLHQVRYIWVVGVIKDENDKTAERLRKASQGATVQIVEARSLVYDGETDAGRRRIRGSEHARFGLEHLTEEDDYLLIHESDLISGGSIIDDLVGLCLGVDGGCSAGWPTMDQEDGSPRVFYDIWAYVKDGKNLKSHSPYYMGHVPGEIVEMDSVGSVWCAPTRFFLGSQQAWPFVLGCRDMCKGIRDQGGRFFVDTSIAIDQPKKRYQKPPGTKEP